MKKHIVLGLRINDQSILKLSKCFQNREIDITFIKKNSKDSVYSELLNNNQIDATIVSTTLEGQNPYTTNELIKIKNEMKDKPFIVIIPKKSYSIQLMREYLDAGIMLAMKESDVTFQALCDLVLKGRSYNQALEYYGIDRTEKASPAAEKLKQPSLLVKPVPKSEDVKNKPLIKDNANPTKPKNKSTSHSVNNLPASDRTKEPRIPDIENGKSDGVQVQNNKKKKANDDFIVKAEHKKVVDVSYNQKKEDDKTTNPAAVKTKKVKQSKKSNLDVKSSLADDVPVQREKGNQKDRLEPSIMMTSAVTSLKSSSTYPTEVPVNDVVKLNTKEKTNPIPKKEKKSEETKLEPNLVIDLKEENILDVDKKVNSNIDLNDKIPTIQVEQELNDINIASVEKDAKSEHISESGKEFSDDLVDIPMDNEVIIPDDTQYQKEFENEDHEIAISIDNENPIDPQGNHKEETITLDIEEPAETIPELDRVKTDLQLESRTLDIYSVIEHSLVQEEDSGAVGTEYDTKIHEPSVQNNTEKEEDGFEHINLSSSAKSGISNLKQSCLSSHQEKIKCNKPDTVGILASDIYQRMETERTIGIIGIAPMVGTSYVAINIANVIREIGQEVTLLDIPNRTNCGIYKTMQLEGRFGDTYSSKQDELCKGLLTNTTNILNDINYSVTNSNKQYDWDNGKTSHLLSNLPGNLVVDAGSGFDELYESGIIDCFTDIILVTTEDTIEAHVDQIRHFKHYLQLSGKRGAVVTNFCNEKRTTNFERYFLGIGTQINIPTQADTEDIYVLEKDSRNLLLQALEIKSKAISTNSKNTPVFVNQLGCLEVAFVGAGKAVGTTQSAIMCAGSLKTDYNVCVIELNYSGHFRRIYESICERPDDNVNHFSYLGIDFYFDIEYIDFNVMYKRNYDFIIIDFGTYTSLSELNNLMRCDIKCIVGQTNGWKQDELQAAHEYFKENDIGHDWKYLITLSEERAIKTVRKNILTKSEVISVPYCTDTYLIDNSIYKLYRSMLDLPMTKRNEKKYSFFKRERI